MLNRRTFVSGISALGAGLMPPSSGFSQTIAGDASLIVPFPAGGTTDVLARLLAEKMRGDYARAVVVFNRGGAGGRIGIAYAKTVPADGSAMLLTPSSMMMVYPHVFKDLGYDPLTDFVPVARLCMVSFMAVVGPVVPEEVKTLADFIAWCEADPKRAMYGSPGAGSVPHLLAAELANKAKVPFVHVPYNGGAPNIAALIGGQVPISFLVYTDARPFKEAGKVRVLATSGPQRSPFAPEVPTVREAGFPGLEAEEWFGVFLPAGASPSIVNALAASVRKALSVPDMTEAMAKQSLVPMLDDPKTFAAALKADHTRWGQIVKAVGFVPQ